MAKQPTKKQGAAIRLRESVEPPMSWVDIGRTMAITPKSARQFYLRGKERLNDDKDENTLERNPGVTAEVLVAQSDPQNESLAAIARDAGVSTHVAKGIIEAASRKMPKPVENLRKVHTARLQDLLDHNSDKILEAISTMPIDTLQAEGVKDLSIAMSVHLEKRALLRKEPTSRIQIEDRRHMNELLGAVQDEILRRGLEVEVNEATQEKQVVDGDLNIYERNKVVDGEIVEGPPHG
jgi:hypothetical protein